MAAKERQRGYWIPYIFFGMFAVIIAVNGALVYWATSTWPGLSSSNHYEKGLAYNDVLEAERAQAALGWTAQAELGEVSGGKGALTVTLRDREGQPLYADQVVAHLIRPTVEGLDSETVMRPSGEGLYRAEASLPEPGVWDLVLEVEQGGRELVSKQRLFVRP